jgi:hypothetical protein
MAADVRSDPDSLWELLAPDFYEIGQSGRRWSRDEIVAALLSDSESVSNFAINEREATTVDQNTVLLSYLLTFGTRTSRRSSLWRWDGLAVQCMFHQGTPVVLTEN